jgi:FkbM family methyltransferase
MKICIVDKLGLCYDGNTLEKHGLGGSESAVILISKELSKIGFDVTVVNNCDDSSYSASGIYNNVRYIDNKNAPTHTDIYDIVIVSRSVYPFLENSHYPFIPTAKKRILWLHDTFVQGDEGVEELVLRGVIHHIFTLSDFHTNYILNANHGNRRNFEVLKKYIFQTRNGAVTYIPEVDLTKKDRNHFVYNASATKGLIPLLEHIWPAVKNRIPDARLTVIGGYYRFREGAEPDQQEQLIKDLANQEYLKNLGITFTGVITQRQIADILANANMMLFPGAFPETFGISTLESLLYKTPLVTTRFGALEETAVEQACYLIDYAIEPNSLFPDINKQNQVQKFINTVIDAYNNTYLHQQKQNYCDVVKDVAGWDTVALQWKQFLYKITGNFLPVKEYRTVTRINKKVARIFGRSMNMPNQQEFTSYSKQRRIIIISPFWNAEQYVSKNVLSVASQDYENFQHILIDDASEDSSHLEVAKVINSLPDNIKPKLNVTVNLTNKGAIFNQLNAVKEFVKDDDIVILLDGDDWLVNNNTIFHYYNDLYNQGYEFTYGSMWSVVDNIPLISQEYPKHVKENKSYREHLFNWRIPYTHLRTVLGKHIKNLDESKFKDENNNWMRSGHDNPLFYELIERVDSNKIYCNREIVCNYNDANPLNDYKIRGEEQNRNAELSYRKPEKLKKRILLAIPTNKYIESETFRSLWNLEVPDGYELEFQYFYGYQIDQIRNLIAHWAVAYDYLFCVDSDIVVPKDALVKMLKADKDIISGLYIQRIPDRQILEIYLQAPFGATNANFDDVKNSGIIEIAACGMGCCLINSNVIRRMEYPHFVYKSAIDHAHTFSEDIYFCFKARELGFTVWADTSIRCDHIGQTTFSLPKHTEPVFSKEKYINEVASMDLLPGDYVEYMKNMNINPKVIYDIGACVLHWTNKAKDIWKDAEYYLFDANPDVEPVLAKSGNPYWIDVLTDTDGKELTFYKKDNNLGGNSYYMETTGEYSESDGVSVVGWTLDGIVEENLWPLPDLIKIDVQGSEVDILRGAKKCLKNCTDIILEAQHTDYNSGAPKVEAVIQFMQEQGFALVSKVSQGYADADYHFKRIS